MTDKAHFTRDEFANKNICEEQNPWFQKNYYIHKIVLWCDFWANGVIGSFFFSKRVVFVNGQCYKWITEKCLYLTVEVIDRDDCYFYRKKQRVTQYVKIWISSSLSLMWHNLKSYVSRVTMKNKIPTEIDELEAVCLSDFPKMFSIFLFS